MWNYMSPSRPIHFIYLFIYSKLLSRIKQLRLLCILQHFGKLDSDIERNDKRNERQKIRPQC